jgi:hypothetical protein
MKRYLVFAGDKYYPLGGMYDFQQDYESRSEAIRVASSEMWALSWAHIYDQKESAYVKTPDGEDKWTSADFAKWEQQERGDA